MEIVLSWLTEYAEHAPLIIFSLLVIAGFSLPISEDLLLLASGMMASSIIPEKTIQLFLAVFIGSIASDVIAYLLGRSFGKSVYKKKWFSESIKKKLEKLEVFYHKRGKWALVIGRCIPFGIRNGIFMTAGIAKMPFYSFFICDLIACFFFSLLLFSLSYSFASHFDVVTEYWHQFSVAVLVAVLIGAGISYFRKKKLRDISI